MLANPPLGEWLSWRGNQSSWGYSPLDQISSNNVNQLQLVWSWAFDDTGAGQAAPLIHNGVMFIPGPRGVVQALNAATGDLIWEYRPGITPSIDDTDRSLNREELGDAAMPASAYAGVGRGVQKNIAIFNELIYMATENASIVAILGQIMPEPLATPLTTTVFPWYSKQLLAPLAKVSEVIMPSAAACQRSRANPASRGANALCIFSTGRASPITPVEKGRTCSVSTPASFANA